MYSLCMPKKKKEGKFPAGITAAVIYVVDTQRPTRAKQMVPHCARPACFTAARSYNPSLLLPAGQGLPAGGSTPRPLCLENSGHVPLVVCPSPRGSREQGDRPPLSLCVCYGIRVLILPAFPVRTGHRKEETCVPQLLLKGSKWLIEINLK